MVRPTTSRCAPLMVALAGVLLVAGCSDDGGDTVASPSASQIASSAPAAASSTASTPPSAATSSAATTAASSSAPSAATGPMVVGLLTSMSGPAGLFGPPTKNVAELAVQEINAAGGVNGQQLKLVVGDDASAPDTGKKAAQQLVDGDKASVLVGMHSSATREAALPIARAANAMYMYTPVFEGGTCDPHMFTNGEVPSQQLQQAIPYVQEKTGKKRWFLLGDDYVWPRKSFEAAKRYIADSGGEVVGEEYVPLGSTDFQSVIQKIQKAKPDLIIPALVGGDAIGFEKQAFDAGIGNDKIQRLATLYEDNTLGAMGKQITEGMVVSLGYFNQLDNPANKAFIAGYRTKFGDKAPPVTTLSEQTYVAIKAWAQAANAAKSVAAPDVAKALTGLTIDAPAGSVTFEANRFMTQPIHVAEIKADGSPSIVQSFEASKADEACAVQ